MQVLAWLNVSIFISFFIYVFNY
ncbi:hypothetical protein PP589_gp24 [Pseudoalteromonas phage HS5]|nr:hypothetical protein PP589_gp24 [Pseudoalteromonas phage HS5]